MSKKESVGDEILTSRASWDFSGDTAINFHSHVSRSVPGYEEGHEIILSLSDYFITREDSHIIDIGSSVGTLIKKLSDIGFIYIKNVIQKKNKSRV